MLSQFDIWKFLAGLGIFLFGMHLLEEALKQLTGRTFKQFLKRHTNNRFKAVLSGTLVTAVLQSSSVVSLMTLAFVGAGIISMHNALGIIFGSNLGTTFTGWIVATLGFKLDIEGFSLPLIGIGALAAMVLDKWSQFSNVGKAILGFGFIFFGLDFMKTSIEYLAGDFDISHFSNYSPFAFLLIGFAFTAIIQSSSAMMVITLSALSTQLISFPSAAATIIGADLGTTITALLGGMPGVAAKKRVALGQFLFNLIIDFIAFVFLSQLIYLVKKIFNMQDDVMALVVFHSTFNLMGILIFIPFLNYFAQFLENRFTKDDHAISKYINLVTEDVPEAAITALQNEALDLLTNVITLQNSAFSATNSFFTFDPPFKDKYFHLKHLEGEMFNFYTKLQQEALSNEESSRLHQLMLVMRYSLHAAKGIKDIEPNLREFYDSTKQELTILHDLFNKANKSFGSELKKIIANQKTDAEELMALSKQLDQHYETILHQLNDNKFSKKLTELEISTTLTVNRELYSGHKSLIYAITYFFLKSDEARQFVSLPVA